jgi:hypothetical protein
MRTTIEQGKKTLIIPGPSSVFRQIIETINIIF